MFEVEKMWENQMFERGVEKYLEGVERAKSRVTKDGKRVVAREEASTTYGIAMMRDLFQDMVDCIDWTLTTRLSKARAQIISLAYIAACDLKEVAYITSRCIIDSISRNESQTALALRIAGHLEDQMRMVSFDETHPKYYKWVAEDLKNRRVSDYRTKRKTLVACHNRAISRDRESGEEVAEWIVWPMTDKVHIGISLIDMFIMATSAYQGDNDCIVPGLDVQYDNSRRIAGSGFVERLVVREGDATKYYISGTDRACEWIKDNMEVCAGLFPEFLPTLIQPKDWTTPTDGGYHIAAMRNRKPLVKTSKNHMALLKYAYMPDVYDAANLAQAVPWQVNDFILGVAHSEFASPHGIGMPGQEPITAPPCPLGDLEQGEMSDDQYRRYKASLRAMLTPDEKHEFAVWSDIAREAYNRDRERISKIIGTGATLRVADLMNDKEEFYYVYTLDYRSRLYPCGTGLNPQGTDLSKALLQFKRGTKLQKDGYWHMCLHAAGVYGVDKVSLEDRVKWVHDNIKAIICSGLTPDEARDFWGSADKPYMFLAVCAELAEVHMLNKIDVNNCLQSDLAWTAAEYQSHIPGAQDGSCNGIQHFSAMLLDPVGAKAVNMTASGEVEDIYNEAAMHVKAKMQRDYDLSRILVGNQYEPVEPDQQILMHKLLNLVEITRKTTKRSTMIIPYGGTKRSCLKHVREWLIEYVSEHKKAEGIVLMTDKEMYHAALILHHYVWNALDVVVVAARKAMAFLRKIVSAVGSIGEPMVWRTPTGFVAYQDIKSSKEKYVELKLFGRMRVYYQEPTDLLNKTKMSTTFPPNFVHSMDASHLMLTVNAAADLGIRDFALVHDSYGVPFGHCEAFHRVIRQQFVNMYTPHVLLGLRQQVLTTYPQLESRLPAPESVGRGAYDIQEVLSAVHFFR